MKTRLSGLGIRLSPKRALYRDLYSEAAIEFVRDVPRYCICNCVWWVYNWAVRSWVWKKDEEEVKEDIKSYHTVTLVLHPWGAFCLINYFSIIFLMSGTDHAWPRKPALMQLISTHGPLSHLFWSFWWYHMGFISRLNLHNCQRTVYSQPVCNSEFI